MMNVHEKMDDAFVKDVTLSVTEFYNQEIVPSYESLQSEFVVYVSQKKEEYTKKQDKLNNEQR